MVRDDHDVWSVEVSTTLVVNGRPRAKIDEVSPTNIIDGETIRFYGNGTDDGTVKGYEWRSDLDGWLGNEPSISISNLSKGNHTISFKVKDNFDIWSLEVVADIQVMMEEKEIRRAEKLVNLTGNKTEIVEIPGSNITLELTSSVDLYNESISIEETTDNTTLDVAPLAPALYFHILVSENISDTLESALIKVYYSEASLPEGISEASLMLYYWNETNRGWEPLAVCGKSAGENYVWARVSHFSIYGVAEFNFPPVAEAGERKQVNVGEEVQFSGVGTDHFNRNTIVLYEWDFDGDGVYDWSSASTGSTSYTYMTSGTYYAKLRVTDDGGGRGFDTVEIVVKEEEGESVPGFGIGALVSGALIALGLAHSMKGGGREKQGTTLLLLTFLVLTAGSIMPLAQEATASSEEDGFCDTTIVDIASSDYRPQEGERVTISAKVFNTGTNNTYTTVWFGYFGNFSAIGEDYTFTKPDEIGVAHVELDTSEMTGEKTIFVIIKNSEPAESNLSNNVGAATITLDILPAEEDEETSYWKNSQMVIIGILCVLTLFFLVKKGKKTPFQMNDVFLIYKDGRLILHESTRLRPDFDAIIMGGMLTAIQKFVQDSFAKDEGDGNLKSFQYEDLHILIENGDYVYCCVSLSTKGKIPVEVRTWLKEAIVLIEGEFHDVLKTWDGYIDTLRGTKKIIRETIILREKK